MRPWRKVTEKEILQTKKDKCRFCVYASRNTKGEDIGNITCDYIGKMKHSRGCSPINCEKFKRKSKKKRGAKREQSDFNGPINP